MFVCLFGCAYNFCDCFRAKIHNFSGGLLLKPYRINIYFIGWIYLNLEHEKHSKSNGLEAVSLTDLSLWVQKHQKLSELKGKNIKENDTTTSKYSKQEEGNFMSKGNFKLYSIEIIDLATVNYYDWKWGFFWFP